MKKSLKVFLACFLGAGIGTLTALQINGYFWWLGLLVGGLVGYLSYEFKAVLKAVPGAWRTVVESWPTKEWWRGFWTYLGSWVIFSLDACIGFLVLINILFWAISEWKTSYILYSVWTLFGMVVFLSLYTTAATLRAEDLTEKKIRKYRATIREWNPIRLYFWLLPKYTVLYSIWLLKGTLHIPGFIWKALPALGRFVKILFRFIKTLFILIHSEIRLLCGIDAAIGAAVGYFADNVIIGALAGGVFGLLNYEIISVRVLHLNASKIKT
ncbi:MAG: hypothetical protein ACOZAL_00170 [Patescibacteria group bacterium]